MDRRDFEQKGRKHFPQSREPVHFERGVVGGLVRAQITFGSNREPHHFCLANTKPDSDTFVSGTFHSVGETNGRYSTTIPGVYIEAPHNGVVSLSVDPGVLTFLGIQANFGGTMPIVSPSPDA